MIHVVIQGSLILWFFLEKFIFYVSCSYRAKAIFYAKNCVRFLFSRTALLKLLKISLYCSFFKYISINIIPENYSHHLYLLGRERYLFRQKISMMYLSFILRKKSLSWDKIVKFSSQICRLHIFCSRLRSLGILLADTLFYSKSSCKILKTLFLIFLFHLQ